MRRFLNHAESPLSLTLSPCPHSHPRITPGELFSEPAKLQNDDSRPSRDFPTHPLGVPGVSHPSRAAHTRRSPPSQSARSGKKSFRRSRESFSRWREISDPDGSRLARSPSPGPLLALPSAGSRPAQVSLPRSPQREAGDYFPPLSTYGRLLSSSPSSSHFSCPVHIAVVSLQRPRFASPHPTPPLQQQEEAERPCAKIHFNNFRKSELVVLKSRGGCCKSGEFCSTFR